MRYIVWAIGAFLLVTPVVTAAQWHDTFYQYRVPLVIEVDRSGWQRLAITAEQITTVINRLEEMPYQPIWFGYNHLKVVAVDQAGGTLDHQLQAGFHLVPAGPELVDPNVVGRDAMVEVPTERGAYYLLRYTSEGGGMQPAHNYRPIFPIGHELRPHEYEVSHEPRLLPLDRSQREQLLRSDGSPLRLDIAGRFVRPLKSISVHKVEIEFLANITAVGRHYWMLYYQPINGHNLALPRQYHEVMPDQSARIIRLGTGEKYLGNTSYSLDAGPALGVWFAETTVKLTPSSPAPAIGRPMISITSASNEAQSFQLVLGAKKPVHVTNMSVSLLSSGPAVIPKQYIEVQQVNYVPIIKSSHISPVRYRGPMGDALTAFTPMQLVPMDGNLAYWITVRTPAGTPAGFYTGAVQITIGSDESVSIPLELEVYGFELPEYSPFRSSMGGAHITKPDTPDSKCVADYHHVSSKQDIRKLARAYYDLMAVNKFTPHNCLQYSTIGLEWSPPPKGFNVKAPGNYFKLYDWDFREFNQDLRHFVNDLKVNAFTLVHTNPSVITMFKHLPGKAVDIFNRAPGHVSLAWQIFREATIVGYDKREQDTYREITKDQFDHLIADFYHTIAANLETHGALDYAYIQVDETAYRGYDVLVDFMRRLKSDPLTARIQFAWTIQSPGGFNYKQAQSDEYAFNGLLDIYVPEINENNHFWEKHFFTDYDVSLHREKLWNYVTHTTRSAIDTPGVNNRSIALEVFNNGGSGYLQWASFQWDTMLHGKALSDNPWVSPYTRWSNGATAYFYPPRKNGPASEPDFTIVPSVRVMTYRESVDDFEYAWLLEKLVKVAENQGCNVSAAREVLNDIGRFFDSTVHWSQNDAWYLDLRERMARAIVDLKSEI